MKCKHGLTTGTCWLCLGNKPKPEGPGSESLQMQFSRGAMLFPGVDSSPRIYVDGSGETNKYNPGMWDKREAKKTGKSGTKC